MTATLQRLHDEGGAAFSELAYSTVDPQLDGSWGTWDPTVGVVAADAAPGVVSVRPARPDARPPPPSTTASAVGVVAVRGRVRGDPRRRRARRSRHRRPAGPRPGCARRRRPDQLATSAAGPAVHHRGLDVDVVDRRRARGRDGARIRGLDPLGAIMGHEFGHQVAFGYGTQAELGAAPEGWPPSGEIPVERWADCVSNTFTGTVGVARPGDVHGSSQTWTTTGSRLDRTPIRVPADSSRPLEQPDAEQLSGPHLGVTWARTPRRGSPRTRSR